MHAKGGALQTLHSRVVVVQGVGLIWGLWWWCGERSGLGVLHVEGDTEPLVLLGSAAVLRRCLSRRCSYGSGPHHYAVEPCRQSLEGGERTGGVSEIAHPQMKCRVSLICGGGPGEILEVIHHHLQNHL